MIDCITEVNEQKAKKFENSIQKRRITNSGFERIDFVLKRGKDIFSELDTDGDGVISLQDKKACLQLGHALVQLCLEERPELADLAGMSQSQFQLFENLPYSLVTPERSEVNVYDVESFLLRNLKDRI